MKHLIIALLGLAVADALLTNALIGCGAGTEGNPMLRELAGEQSFLAIKIGASLLCGRILWQAFKKRPRLAMLTTLGTAVTYAGIVTWNTSILVLAASYT